MVGRWCTTDGAAGSVGTLKACNTGGVYEIGTVLEGMECKWVSFVEIRRKNITAKGKITEIQSHLCHQSSRKIALHYHRVDNTMLFDGTSCPNHGNMRHRIVAGGL